MAKVNLIIQTAFVGDLLLSIPLIRRVRALDPDRRIVLLCRKSFGDFFLKTQLVDRVIEVDKSKPESRDWALSEVKKLDCHWLISPHESWTSARFSHAAQAERKIGYKHWWNFWAFDQREMRIMDLPEALRQLYLVSTLDPQLKKNLETFTNEWRESTKSEKSTSHASFPLANMPAWADMRLEHFDEWKRAPSAVRDLVERVGLFKRSTAILAPGSVWPTKMWTETGFVDLGRELVARNFHVVTLGAPSEVEICNRVASAIGPLATSIAGQTTLYESAWVMSRAQILFCNDSGAMHMASVVGLPSVAMFGPTTLKFGYRPWQKRAWVAQIPMECRPCEIHGGRKCPIGTHACMKDLSYKEVLHAFGQL